MRAMSISHQARASLGPKLIESRPSGNTNLVPGGTVKTSASDTRSSPGAPKPCNKMTTGPLPPPCPSVPPLIRTSNPPTLSRRMCRTVHQCPPPWASQLAEYLRKSALSEKLLGDDFEDGVGVGDVHESVGAAENNAANPAAAEVYEEQIVVVVHLHDARPADCDRIRHGDRILPAPTLRAGAENERQPRKGEEPDEYALCSEGHMSAC